MIAVCLFRVVVLCTTRVGSMVLAVMDVMVVLAVMVVAVFVIFCSLGLVTKVD